MADEIYGSALEFVVFRLLGINGFAPPRVRPSQVGVLRKTALEKVMTHLTRVSTLTGPELRDEANRWWKTAELARFGDELPRDALDAVVNDISKKFAPDPFDDDDDLDEDGES